MADIDPKVGLDATLRRGPLGQRNYLQGFGYQFETEAEPGALPRKNNPLHVPYGLYAEQITTTNFMAPRQHNHWIYAFRLRPSCVQGYPRQIDNGLFLTAPLANPPQPRQFRWNPLEIPSTPQDFLQSLATVCANGDARMQAGMAIHAYLANRDMTDSFFANLDGELVIFPQVGDLLVKTELGILEVTPGEVLIIPRGIKFQVSLPEGSGRGIIAENYGAPLRLPDLGPLGSKGLASPTDFYAPIAAYEDRAGDFRLVQKFCGQLWQWDLSHSPLDVVAWRGSSVPVKYDMNEFNTMGAVAFDHADPSIFTCLTSPSDPMIGANADFLILGPQWVAGETTFRTAPFHRNVACEFASMIVGSSPNKADKAGAGTMLIHNVHAPHGPDEGTFARAANRPPEPYKIENSIMIAFESRYAMAVTDFALGTPSLQDDYPSVWTGYQSRFHRP